MPRDARTVAKYVVAGLALAAMLALAPFFFASGLMGTRLDCRRVHRRLVGALRAWLLLDSTQTLVGGAAALHRRRFLAGRMNADAAWLGWTP
jgi:hypothetical protein